MDTACRCGGHGATQIAMAQSSVTPEQTVQEAARRPGALEVMQRRLDKLTELGTSVVTISGGEPMMHPQIDASLTLTEAAASAGIPLPTLLAALEKAGAPA